MSILIVANGEITDDSWLQERAARATAVVAADGGAFHLLRAGVRPVVVVGDLDSLDDDAVTELTTLNVPLRRFPADKDETDLELALRAAVALGEGPIDIAGALGGRLDQTLGNLFLLAHPLLDGRRARLVEPHQAAWLAAPETVVEGAPGDRLSLIPLGEDVFIAETSGLRWPLRDTWLRFGATRGLSNELTSVRAVVRGVRGRLVVVHLAGEWGR